MMKIENYKKRVLDQKIETYLKLFGAVCIEGPKYCGKTWLGKYHSNSMVLLHNDNTNETTNLIELAKMSPTTILEGETPRLIDEWQEATNLWDAIRIDIDNKGKKGQYILTGSSTPNRKGILHSGAGRFGKIRMRPMSLYESGDSTGDISLKDICDGKTIHKLTGDIDIKRLAKLIIRGGFPGNIELSTKEVSVTINEYINLIIDDDIYRLDNIKRDSHKVKLLLKSLARNESTTVSNKTLIRDIKDKDLEDIDKETVQIYLDALNRLFLLDNDEPFSTNIRSSVRVKQSEKRHFTDPSITCSLLNIKSEDMLIKDLETFGLLFEALVERDLKVYADSFNAKCYHYQDYQEKEIDSIIELEDGDWCAFEIKLGAHQIEEAAQNLLKIKNDIVKENGKPPKVLCVICGLTSSSYKRPDGVYVVPITALKP